MIFHALKRLGLPGVLGLALLGGAAWAQWRWLPERVAQVDALSSQARHLRHDMLALAQGPASKAAPALSPEAAWQALWLSLPLPSQRTPLQSDVLASAQALGLSLSAVQFKGGPEGATGLWRQRLVMPTQGRYGDVRAWVGQLLSQPAVSLDALDIQRPDVMSDEVKARVSVSLWWRATEGAR